jgi:hypothetical protein
MANRGMAFLLSDIVSKSYCTPSVPVGGTEPAGLTSINLQTDEPSEIARITSLDPNASQWKFTLSTGLYKNVDAVCAVNMPLSPYGKFRVMGNCGPSGYLTFVEVAANSIVSSTNRSGALTDIDEVIASPDGLYMSPTVTTSAWAVNLGFGTPSSTPVVGAYRQMFVLRLQLFGTPTNFYPTVSAIVDQGGTTIASFAPRAVTTSAAGGQIIILSFDASAFLVASGSNVHLQLSFTPGDNSSYIKMDTARWYTDATISAIGGAPFPLYDSGWQDSPTGYYTDEDPISPTVTLQYFAPSTWGSEPIGVHSNKGVNVLTLAIQDDQIDHAPYVYTGSPGGVPATIANLWLPPGYVQTGLVRGGTCIFFGTSSVGSTSPSSGIQRPGPGSGILVNELGGRTIGGQSYGADAWRLRQGDPINIIGTRDEILTLQNRIAWRKGHAGPFFAAMDPDILPQYQMFSSGFWTLTGMTAPQPMADNGTTGAALYTTAITLEEKL